MADRRLADVSRWKIVLGAIIGGLVVLWLILFVTVGGDFYRSVEEVTAGTGAGSGAQNVRVGGTVVSGTVDQQGAQVQFAVEGETGEQLSVVYEGPYPERLQPGAEVVVAGSLVSSERFAATEVLVKCPDKLFAEKVTNEVLTGTGLERLLY